MFFVLIWELRGCYLCFFVFRILKRDVFGEQVKIVFHAFYQNTSKNCSPIF